MIRNLNIYVNPTEGAVTSIEGNSSFYLGDNNQITVIPNTEDNYLISISANLPGAGAVIGELTKDIDGYILEKEDLNTFLINPGIIKCNIHISNMDGERLTTLPFQIQSILAFDREGTIVTPTNVRTLEDFYIALDELEKLDIEKLIEAIAIIKQIDIEKIEEALRIVDELDGKIEELDKTIAEAKETDEELAATLIVIKQMLESGALKGEKGDTYNLTEKDKEDIAEVVLSIITNAEEVRF